MGIQPRWGYLVHPVVSPQIFRFLGGGGSDSIEMNGGVGISGGRGGQGSPSAAPRPRAGNETRQQCSSPSPPTICNLRSPAGLSRGALGLGHWGSQYAFPGNPLGPLPPSGAKSPQWEQERVGFVWVGHTSPGGSGVGTLPIPGAHPSCPADVHGAAGCTHVSLHVHVSMWAAHLHTSRAQAFQACSSVHMHRHCGCTHRL